MSPQPPPQQPAPAQPALAPRIGPAVAGLLTDPAVLHAAVRAHGSPLNVVLPAAVDGNVARLRAVLAGVRHRIWFAHKASASPALVRAALAAGAGVDVASAGEWISATAAGADPADLLVTGPKGPALVARAVRAGAVLNVDSLWELERVAALSRAAGGRTRVLLRLSGFGPGRLSRFGVPPQQWTAALDLLVREQQVLDFLGPAFHLDSSEVRDRVAAVAACLTFLERAVGAGPAPTVLDVGGGLRQVFLAEPAGYEQFLGDLRRGALGLGPAMGWDGDLFGLRVEAGTVTGTPSVHKYGNRVPADAGLAALLAAPLPGHAGRTVAQVLADTLLELWLEPGKAVVDQAGVTLCTVEFVSTAADGSTVVHVDLSRDKVCPADQEVLVDPVLLPAPGRPGTADADEGVPVTGFVAGNLCLERDLVCRHRVTWPRPPRPGDLLAFVNTAAYCMDLSAAEGLLQPRPARVAVLGAGAARQFVPDVRPDVRPDPGAGLGAPR